MFPSLLFLFAKFYSNTIFFMMAVEHKEKSGGVEHKAALTKLLTKRHFVCPSSILAVFIDFLYHPVDVLMCFFVCGWKFKM